METELLDLKGADSTLVAEEAVKILLEKKGVDVRLYDVREKSPITDYYINVTGRSSTQVAALADDVVHLLGERGLECARVEGRRDNAWLLVDFTDVIVNVFDRPSREFYDLDRHLPADSSVDISYLVKIVDDKYDLSKK